MKTILDVNQVALQLFLQMAAQEYLRDDARDVEAMATQAFEQAEGFLEVAVREAHLAELDGV